MKTYTKQGKPFWLKRQTFSLAPPMKRMSLVAEDVIRVLEEKAPVQPVNQPRTR